MSIDMSFTYSVIFLPVMYVPDKTGSMGAWVSSITDQVAEPIIQQKKFYDTIYPY